MSISVAIQNAVQDAFAIEVNYRSCPYKLCKTFNEELVHQTLNVFDREHFILLL